LHGHAVGAEVGVTAATFHFLICWVGKVVNENFLGERQGATEAFATKGGALHKGAIDGIHE
jgi:hypothetical protein